MFHLKFLLFYLINEASSFKAWWTEFELIGADNSMTGQVRTALRIRRNKYTYSIEGTWQLVKDCRYDFDVSIQLD